MDVATLEYIRGLKPAPHADGRELVKKGIEIGNSFEAPLTWYEGYANHMEFKKGVSAGRQDLLVSADGTCDACGRGRCC